MTQRSSSESAPKAGGWPLAALLALLVAAPAHASFMQGETLAKAANVIAWVVIVICADRRDRGVLDGARAARENRAQAPSSQTEAIQVLCLLSLVFGGLLWPLAWLWAYTKPVLYKMAYGTDKAAGDHARRPRRRAWRGATCVRRGTTASRPREASVTSGAPAELTEIRDRLRRSNRG